LTPQCPAQERLLREEEILAVLHVENRVAAERVLVVARRHIHAHEVLPPQNRGVALEDSRKGAGLGALEVREDVADPLGGHEHEHVRPHRPPHTVVVSQARLEVEEWLARLEGKRRRVPVVGDGDRLEVAVPIELRAQRHEPLARW
jgi:hypothetical protein